MEQVFDSGNFSETHKVVFASRILEGEAADWWDAVSQSMSTERRAAMTWRDFSARVENRFCATSAVQRAGREFLDLRMGNMAVGKFNSLFLEKLQFARRFCPDEPSLVARYVEALPPSYRATVRGKLTLEAAMEEARIIEGDQKEQGVTTTPEGNKRKFEETSGSSKKKSGREDSKKLEGHWCKECSNRHSGPCTVDTKRCRNCNKSGHDHTTCKNPSVCYNCNESGHISRDCKKEKKERSCFTCGEVGHKNWECPKNAVKKAK